MQYQLGDTDLSLVSLSTKNVSVKLINSGGFNLTVSLILNDSKCPICISLINNYLTKRRKYSEIIIFRYKYITKVVSPSLLRLIRYALLFATFCNVFI